MSSTAKRLYQQHAQLAQQAEAVGNRLLAEHHRRCALTYTFPVGEIISQTFN